MLTYVSMWENIGPEYIEKQNSGEKKAALA